MKNNFSLRVSQLCGSWPISRTRLRNAVARGLLDLLQKLLGTRITQAEIGKLMDRTGGIRERRETFEKFAKEIARWKVNELPKTDRINHPSGGSRSKLDKRERERERKDPNYSIAFCLWLGRRNKIIYPSFPFVSTIRSGILDVDSCLLVFR